jgi:hypothetical protein
MKIERAWAMPNKRTFQIKPIKELMKEEMSEGERYWVEPFPFVYRVDALMMLSVLDDAEVDGVLFDPPYSPRQLKECYDNIGQPLHDTTSRVWAQWKDEIARVIKPGGKCISFGWSSNGLGKKRGFEITRILLVAHGGNHNDTIVTVERKIQETLE